MGRRRHRSCNKKKDCHCHKKKTKFCIVLTGSQEVPPVETTGIGAGTAVLSHSKNKLFFKFKFEKLTSPVQEPGTGVGYIHFHLAAAGQNGPIVKNITNDVKLDLNKKSGKVCGCWASWDETPFTEDLLKELEKGNIYVNIHTKDHPSGELRGQVVKLL